MRGESGELFLELDFKKDIPEGISTIFLIDFVFEQTFTNPIPSVVYQGKNDIVTLYVNLTRSG